MINFAKLKFLVLFCLLFTTNIVSAENQVCAIEGDIVCFFERAETNFSKENFDRVQITKDYITFIELSEDNLPINIEKIATAYQHLADINWQRTHYKFNYFPNNTQEDVLKIINYYKRSFELGSIVAAAKLCNIYENEITYELRNDYNFLKDYKKNGIYFCEYYLDNRVKSLLGNYKEWNSVQKIKLDHYVQYSLGWIYAPSDILDLDIIETKKSVKIFDQFSIGCQSNIDKLIDSDLFLKEKCARAYNRLGWIYANGVGISIDKSKSLFYYNLATDLGDFNAISDIADIHLEGANGKANINLAIREYNKALSLNPLDIGSRLNLGKIYYFGIGVDTDKSKAKEYFISIFDQYHSQKDFKNKNIKAKIEKAYSTIKYFINENKDYEFKEKQAIDYLCDDILINFNNNYDTSLFVDSCIKLADQNYIPALKYKSLFFEYGVSRNKNIIIALSTQQKIIDLLKSNKTLRSKYPKQIYKSKKIIAIKIFQGKLDYHKANNIRDSLNALSFTPQIAYEYFTDSLADSEEFIDSAIYIATMKIEGWGTDRDIESARSLLMQIYDTYLDTDNIDEQAFIYRVQKELDKLNSIQQGFRVPSKVYTQFPATFSGQFHWENDIGNHVVFNINSLNRIGLNKYSFDGLIDYEYITEQVDSRFEIEGQYNISGSINIETRAISFDEFDVGNYYTFKANEYYHGQFYGKFNESFTEINATYVTPDKDFGLLTAKRIELTAKNQFANLRNQINIGKQYALMIGNNNYENIVDLETATADARSFGNILENKYGFIVKEPLIDATRNDILLSLDNLINQLDESDSLVIFYAGHGRIDEDTKRGYWTPVDGLADSYRNDISNDDITNVLKKIKARHILVIADSCYSGSLIRSSKFRNKSNQDIQYFEQLNNKKSRKVITSGGLEPVSDSGANGHSAFANVMLQKLKDNKKVLTAENLYQSIKPVIMSEYQQTPLYNPVNKSGDLGGEMLFIPIQ